MEQSMGESGLNPNAVGTGTYYDVVGVEAATEWFDAKDALELANVRFAQVTAGIKPLSEEARLEFPYLD